MTSKPAAASGATLRAQIRLVSGQPWTSRSGSPGGCAGTTRQYAISTPRRTSERSIGGAEGTEADSRLRPVSAEHRYDPKEIEPRWQRVWAQERTWEVSNETRASQDPRDKSYVLERPPYATGEPHIGPLKVYSVGDAIAHFHRRTGRRVLHPMGYDAFGLPAENHAIKSGQHPRESTDVAIREFQRQFRSWGISIDWSREFGTHEPRYYRWTQWIFLQLFNAGLAYRKEAAVKWCPNDQTVLANEQVIDGRCERCGFVVEAR